MRRRMGRPGLMGTMARTAVVAGTATAVSGGVRQHAAQKQAAEQAPAPVPQDIPAEPATQAPAAPAAPAPGMSSTDKIAAIKGLGELKDQGLLTEQEFAAEKAKILAG
jgi:negative regulator of sigma E activity